MNKLKKWLRDWHIWLGVAFAIPLLIIGITTLLLSHQHTLKLEKYSISSQYFPGYWNEKNEAKNEIKTFFKDDNGNEYYGYKYGLMVKTHTSSQKIDFFNRYEIRKINMYHNKLLVATKQGLFYEQDNRFKELLKEEIWDMFLEENKAHIVTKQGLFTCDNQFQACDKIDLKETNEPLKEVSLKKLNLDLHTGKAFFGKTFEWIWQDILALSILFFVLSGFYLWYKRKNNKHKKQLNH